MGCLVLHSCFSQGQQYSQGGQATGVSPCTAMPHLPRGTGGGPAMVSHSCFSESRDCPPQLQAWRSKGDRTVLVIAHRLHTVQNVDQVLVLKQGQLVEHSQLREDQDVYAHLVQQQRLEE